MDIKRTFEKQIRNAKSKFVCITISGARQTGKSTMVRHLFSETIHYVTIDDLSIRDSKDPFHIKLF